MGSMGGDCAGVGRWVPYLPDGQICACGRIYVRSRAPAPSPEPRGHSLLRALFSDGDVRDFDPEETRFRDLETRRWYESLPLAERLGDWRVFVPDYSLPVHAETLAFERLLRRGRIEFNSSVVGAFRIRPRR